MCDDNRKKLCALLKNILYCADNNQTKNIVCSNKYTIIANFYGIYIQILPFVSDSLSQINKIMRVFVEDKE